MKPIIWRGALLASLATGLAMSPAQVRGQVSPRQLFEAGQYEEALAGFHERTETAEDPADRFMAVQALLKLDRGEQARQELEKLLQREDVWALVAQSAAALMDGEKEKAREIAGRAVEAEPDQFFVRYQQGLAAAEGGEWQTAAAAFERATQIDPLFAYAHYYAGLSYSRIKRVDRTAAYFERFLKLAPKAPERPAVESLMRTLRGR